MNKLWPLVPCAGHGERFGSTLPKQYVKIFGQAVVAYTLDALQQVSGIEPTTIVISATDTLFKIHCPSFKGTVAPVGGATRAQSVRAGLGALRKQGASDKDWVLVHDAARCLVLPQWIDTLIQSCAHDDVGGLLACPVPDTLKQAVDGRSVVTIERKDKWLAQTPQMFRLATLEHALDQSLDATSQQKTSDPINITDEASAIEALGLHPKLIICSPDNFKLTYPHDFERAQAILEKRHHLK